MCEIVTGLCADLKQLNRWIEIILLHNLFTMLNFTQNQIITYNRKNARE